MNAASELKDTSRGFLPDLGAPMEAVVTQFVNERAGEIAGREATKDPKFREVQARTSELSKKVLSAVGKELYFEFEKSSAYERVLLENHVYRQGFMDGMKFVMAMSAE
ncbi:Hypothetical protein DEACI_3120 [Acididesulfobacillus acetoxydans]|uniref:Uncharacterized protein n=1 Tax=Acididesulfobacillus acetoxydans TaxID=1561005 RepID=A0A8S0XCH1_9FIRM|nr:hypothetical protein [Acididesulfobacillus acetoxydans]CAA7602446.1 Hypothetical protein DEACI_3120 [Acididesulfobacillus acetoxydans]CEJ05901.1 Hypothetical protein DEACI_0321 [Acididesulfobacillus acetoxydans]